MDLQPGNVIDNRYVVEAEIGRGGMAAVYRVRHAQLGTLAALKVLTMPAASIQERLLHEGRVQAALQHPNIVTVSDVVIHNGAPGLVMEYVRGPSLDDFLMKRRMSFEQADEIAQGVLAGVRAAHNHGLIHRDLKPANIMLAITDSGLIPKVADFGLVKMLEGDAPSMSKTRSGVAMGTPAYMAPEQISDAKNVDYRADIFSLGAILYELVTNLRAFDHDDMFQTFSAIMSGNYTALREIKPDIPECMERAIVGALHTDREQRIQTVADLLAIWKGEMGADGARTASTSLWDADFLSEVSSMGAGGETSAESLRRSMRSGVGGAGVVGQTAAPHPNDEATRIPADGGMTQGTMAPIPGMFADEMPHSAQAQHPGNAPQNVLQSAETVDPAPVAARPATPAEAPASGTSPAMLIGVAGIGLFFLALGSVAVGGWAMGMFDRPDVPIVEPAPDPLPVPSPDPVPEPVPEPTVEPTPVATPTPVPVPTPVPTPTPVPDPTPVPVPVTPDPTPVPVPQPDPVPAPTPVVPDPAPVVQPAPVPPPAPTGPKVYLNGQGATIQILDGNGVNVQPSKVKAGVAYEIRALWSPSTPSSVVSAAEVFEDGKHYEIRCAPAKQKCVVRAE